MGAMMGTGMGAWILLCVIVAVAAVVTAGVVAARTISAGHKAEPPPLLPAKPPAGREAKDALTMRYAKGEIDREEYLQGKVELED